ncbi:hypothetical protein FGD71_035915, partial [Streptomyces sporangiiformans]
ARREPRGRRAGSRRGPRCPARARARRGRRPRARSAARAGRSSPRRTRPFRPVPGVGQIPVAGARGAAVPPLRRRPATVAPERYSGPPARHSPGRHSDHEVIHSG